MLEVAESEVEKVSGVLKEAMESVMETGSWADAPATIRMLNAISKALLKNPCMFCYL